MTDVMSADKRSALMSRIRGKNTKPELLLRKHLWRAGYRYRLHPADLEGRPDLVLPKWRAIVFVHGCFWHAHGGCPYFQLPATQSEFWRTKLSRNRERDAAIVAKLSQKGWRIAIVWECALRADTSATGSAIVRWLKRGGATIELERRKDVVLQHPLSSAH